MGEHRGSFRDADVWIAHFDGYDRAVIYWLLNNIKREGKSIPAVFATPERAFGQLSKVLGRKFGRTYTAKTVPLPFISLSRLTDRLDHDTRWHAGRLRKIQAVNSAGVKSADPGDTPDDADAIDAWQGMTFPQPITLTYQVEAWARNRRDLDLIKTRVLQAFEHGDTTYIDVKHPEPWDYRLRPLTLTGVQDTSQLEAPEGSERSLRETYDFTIQGWVLFPATTIKAVKAAEVEIQEQDTEEEIETWTLYDER